jgi:hypothetical protein
MRTLIAAVLGLAVLGANVAAAQSYRDGYRGYTQEFQKNHGQGDYKGTTGGAAGK